MQRPQGISVHADDAPVEPDVGLRLSTALRRLAALRATIHGDWSDGPASLLEVANVELPGTDALCWANGAAPPVAAPELWIELSPRTPAVEAAAAEEPMPLRGRFSDLLDENVTVSPIDMLWLDLVDENALVSAEDGEALTSWPADETPVVISPDVIEIDDVEPAFAVGAFAIVFDLTPDAASVKGVVETPVEDDIDADVGLHFGAVPTLAALLDLTPEHDTTPAVIRAFDPMSLIDDALADAFDALVRAPDPVDPFDAAWTPDAFTDTDHAAHLAALESHLWALPRHVPCAETFLLTPNHETAVRITRSLRVRANALEARAFADTAAFGFLRSDTDAEAFWFLADALHDAASLSAGDSDVDASFADWRMNDDGLLVVTAPDNVDPKRPPPLISEAELDALFAHVDDAQSRVVLDDLGDDPTWNDTFWCDVDTYLEHVSETMDPAMIDHSEMQDDAFDIHDIEVRAKPVPMPATTFFWMPGDDYGLAVDGDGDDLFIVGGNETAAVVLIEDGSSYAMRTGQTARMDEMVISLSSDAWSYIDGMHWERVATLSGIAQVRVEQNAARSRHAVIAGSFFATTLEDDGVRLVLSGDDGDVDYPVIRVGGAAVDGGDWPFSTAREADAVFV